MSPSFSRRHKVTRSFTPITDNTRRFFFSPIPIRPTFPSGLVRLDATFCRLTSPWVIVAACSCYLRFLLLSLFPFSVLTPPLPLPPAMSGFFPLLSIAKRRTVAWYFFPTMPKPHVFSFGVPPFLLNLSQCSPRGSGLLRLTIGVWNWFFYLRRSVPPFTIEGVGWIFFFPRLSPLRFLLLIKTPPELILE